MCFGTAIAVGSAVLDRVGVEVLNSDGRPAGLFEDPNAFAVNSVVILVVVLLMPTEEIGLRTTSRLLLAVALGLSVIASDSRTGLLALGGGLALVGLLYARAAIRTRLGVLVLLLLIALSGLALRLGLSDAVSRPFTRRVATIDTRFAQLRYAVDLFWESTGLRCRARISTGRWSAADSQFRSVAARGVGDCWSGSGGPGSWPGQSGVLSSLQGLDRRLFAGSRGPAERDEVPCLCRRLESKPCTSVHYG